MGRGWGDRVRGEVEEREEEGLRRGWGERVRGGVEERSRKGRLGQVGGVRELSTNHLYKYCWQIRKICSSSQSIE